MGNWHRRAARMAVRIERYVDRWRASRSTSGAADPNLKIIPYRGYGSSQSIFLKGRVLRQKQMRSLHDEESIWRNLVNTFKRFNSHEFPGARIAFTYGDFQEEAVADEEGFFEFKSKHNFNFPSDRIWHEANVQVSWPHLQNGMVVKETTQILVPAPEAHFGVISDMDDTVLQTGAHNTLRMLKTILFGSAKTRLPFKGVASFYQALQEGTAHRPINPLFYVSSSPWNLYDLLNEFFVLQGIPVGPIFLRDWGVTEHEIFPTAHRGHKITVIRDILETYPRLSFILLGDSGQEDPEIYEEVVRLYPKRILAVYIRNVSKDLKRPASIRALAEKVLEAGTTMILADDTLAAASHALQNGWIARERFPEIQAEKEKAEKSELIHEKAPTIVVGK